jgi:hypothetical protein
MYRIVSARFLGFFCLLCMLAGSHPALALDVFSLWRQPELAIEIFDGAWVEYRTQTVEGGKRSIEYTRLQCVGENGSYWTIEAVPMEETGNRLQPIPGEGWRFELSRTVLEREGNLLDYINTVIHWEGGTATSLSGEQWRDDPLLATSFPSGLPLSGLEEKDGTVRVVSGVELMCRQYVVAVHDTNTVALPRGEMKQYLYKEVGVAVHENVPFFNIAYAAERINTETAIIPQGRSRRPPPPTSRVQIMELVGYGRSAESTLR